MTLPNGQLVSNQAGTKYPLRVLNGLCQFSLFLPRTFLRHVRFDKSGCWIWHGAIGFHPQYRYHRYGQLKYWDASKNKRVSTSAHRYAYVKVFGPVAPELDIDHLCQNKLCVNPAHLEAVTHQENICRIPEDRKARTGGRRRSK